MARRGHQWPDVSCSYRDHAATAEGDDWLPEEPATAAAHELLPEWVRWSGEQAAIPGLLVERSVAIAERRQSDTSDCPSFRFRPRPGGVP